MRAKKIVITGAESSGKSTLTKQLASYYNKPFLKEYAREYVENLKRDYTFNDVEFIAKIQIDLELEMSKNADSFFFIDTSLIITKVWFEEVYKKLPNWFMKHFKESFADFYLLCNNDLEWIPDNVRENGGEKRNYLFKLYKDNLIKYSQNFEIIKGQNNQRLENAVFYTNKYIKTI